MNIGENIRFLRKKNGMTQVELGKCVGVEGATITRYENNVIIPSLETLRKIADAFGIDTVYLTHSEEERESLKAMEKKLEKMELFLKTARANDNSCLLEYYSRLNPTGQQKAFDYIQDLSEQPKYLKIQDK